MWYQYNGSQTHTCTYIYVYHCTWFITSIYVRTCMCLWTIVLYNGLLSIYVRTYIDNKPCSIVYCLYMYVHVCVCEPLYYMVYCLYIYVHVCVCEPLYIDCNICTYMYVSVTIVLGSLSIYVRTCMCLWTIVLYGLLSIYI